LRDELELSRKREADLEFKVQNVQQMAYEFKNMLARQTRELHRDDD
jgi:hypothetical protein